MGWEDWGEDKFPVNAPGTEHFIDTETARLGEGGVIVGFQYGWGGKDDNGEWYNKPYWIVWKVTAPHYAPLLRRAEGIQHAKPPAALPFIFLTAYQRSGFGRIPLMSFTAEEWAAMEEVDNERRIPGVLEP